MKELIFFYNDRRCHASILHSKNVLFGDEKYIGTIEGYEIYQIPTTWFDQFGFIAIKFK